MSLPGHERSVHDPGEVVIIFDAQDIGRAKELAASSELRTAMTAAGVTDNPDIYFLNAAS